MDFIISNILNFTFQKKVRNIDFDITTSYLHEVILIHKRLTNQRSKSFIYMIHYYKQSLSNK